VARKHGEKWISMASLRRACVPEQFFKLNVPSVLQFCSIEEVDHPKQWITVSAHSSRLRRPRGKETGQKKDFYGFSGTCLRPGTILQLKCTIDSPVLQHRGGGPPETTDYSFSQQQSFAVATRQGNMAKKGFLWLLWDVLTSGNEPSSYMDHRFSSFTV